MIQLVQAVYNVIVLVYVPARLNTAEPHVQVTKPFDQFEQLSKNCPFFPVPCFEYEYDYQNTLCVASGCAAIKGISSAQACQAECAAESGCTHFVYCSASSCGTVGDCVLKTSNTGGTASAGWISGPKTCP